MTHPIDRPSVGLSIYVTLCCVGATAFALWMYALLVPIRADNPGLTAYKPPPAAVVNYRPAALPSAPPRDALKVADPKPPLSSKEMSAEVAAAPALQHPGDMKDTRTTAIRMKRAAPKRQVTVRRNDPRQKRNEFAFQPFFGGGFRPWN
ncbi:MAG TPA: hypothetical protein VH684_12165 [Xanthobacteraceae bacterium]